MWIDVKIQRSGTISYTQKTATCFATRSRPYSDCSCHRDSWRTALRPRRSSQCSKPSRRCPANAQARHNLEILMRNTGRWVEGVIDPAGGPPLW